MIETRRGFLTSAAALAAASRVAAAEAGAPLPTVRLGKHEVSRLVVGSNPFSGASHFNPILDQLMREWMTPERILEILKRCEQAGIRTWQLHNDPKLLDCLRQYRAEGGKMNCIILSDFKEPKQTLPELAKMGPIGIAHHGERSDVLLRTRQMDAIPDFLKAARDVGVMAGISTHNPAVIDHVESKGWDPDFYMACVYRRSRTPEEVRAEFGEATVGEPYFEKDPERMCKMIRQTRKTCFAFKILAAGRAFKPPQTVEQAFRFVFENIKPQDCVIVGLYPRFKDEITQNAQLTRRYAADPRISED
jgi:hypothetical protein